MSPQDWHGHFVALDWPQACCLVPGLDNLGMMTVSAEVMVAIATALEQLAAPNGYTLVSIITPPGTHPQILFRRTAALH